MTAKALCVALDKCAIMTELAPLIRQATTYRKHGEVGQALARALERLCPDKRMPTKGSES